MYPRTLITNKGNEKMKEKESVGLIIESEEKSSETNE